MFKRAITIILMFVMVLTIFTSCAQKDATSKPTDNGSTAATKAPDSSKELDEVTLVFPRSFECLDDAHVISAIKLGYFEEEGIKVKFEQAYGTDDLKMVCFSKADFGYPSSFVQIAGHEAKLPFISVYQVDNCNIFGFGVNPGSSIKSIADLKGKTISLGDPAWSTISDPILMAAGVKPSEVTYVTAGENRAQVVKEGKVDAVLTWYKEFELWEGQGVPLNYLAGQDVLKITGGGLAIAKDRLEKDKDMIERFTRAYAKGSYFAYLNPAAAAEMTLENFPSIKTEFKYALNAVKGLVYIDNGEDVEKNGYGWHNPAKWEKQMEACRQGGTLTRTDLKNDEIYTNDFVKAANSFDKKKIEADAANYKLKAENQQFATSNPPRP